MFNGSFSGNLIGFLYFTVFICGGIFISNNLFRKLSAITRLWLGTVTGTVALMWLPVAVSFILGFNVLSHVIALVLLAIASFLSLLYAKKCGISTTYAIRGEDLICLIPVAVMTVFYLIVQTSHIMQPSSDGGMIFGQSTYADVHIHLSFITAPIAQGTVPFQYNIAPHVQVSYPFLSDTVSSSVYIFGASLRWAYIVPTVLGAFNVYLGAMIFFRTWLKRFAKALIAWLLFTFNGGFGFWYFFDNMRSTEGESFTRIFDTLYQTPTNLDGNMIRWVNTFCDMMIPQRATLFGWMMFFAIIYLLYRAVFLKETKLFIPAGILAGLTPLISTHIFLATGIIAAVWMLSRLFTHCLEGQSLYAKRYAGDVAVSMLIVGALTFILSRSLGDGAVKPAFTRGLESFLTAISLTYLMLYLPMLIRKGRSPKIFDKYKSSLAISIPAVALLSFAITYLSEAQSFSSELERAGFTTLTVLGPALIALYLALILTKLRTGGFKELLSTWGIFLITVLILALPQLFCFTFKQSSGDGFLTPHFNWINSKDTYFWFYVKNMGVPALFIIPAVLASSKRDKSIVAPVAALMLIAETVALQPNPYDNNKIIYPAFFLAIGVVASYMVNVYDKLKSIRGTKLVAGGVIVACVLSGALSMGREYVADEYVMFSASDVAVAEWIGENTENDDTILTNSRYNNSIPGLTGRSIVCGGEWFYSMHGLPDYKLRQNDVKKMYSDPVSNKALFEKYSVDYVVISSHERNEYTVDEQAFKDNFNLVYNENNVLVFKVS